MAKRNRQARRQQHSETEDQQGAEEQQDPEEQQEADEQQDAEEQGGQTGLGAQDATTAMSLDLIATSCFPRAFQSSGEAEFPVSAFEKPFDHHSPFLGDLRDPLWHKRWQSGQSSQAQKLTLSQPATNAETRDFTTEGDIDSFTFVAPLPLPLRPYGHLAVSAAFFERLHKS